MKTKLVLFCVMCALLQPFSLLHAVEIKQTESHNIFKGVMLSIWAKLRSLNPTQRQTAKGDVIYTAGIRGAEATDTLLKLYWKGDLTSDPVFQAELVKFNKAQKLLDQGELAGAVTAFDGFLDNYSQSQLRPNALFGKSISLAGLGKKQQSTESLKLFIDENPNHPLFPEAKQLLASL